MSELTRFDLESMHEDLVFAKLYFGENSGPHKTEINRALSNATATCRKALNSSSARQSNAVPVEAQEALSALSSIRRETTPEEGHRDPGAIHDCFETVREYIEQAAVWRGAILRIKQQYLPDQDAAIDLAECHRIAREAIPDGDES